MLHVHDVPASRILQMRPVIFSCDPTPPERFVNGRIAFSPLGMHNPPIEQKRVLIMQGSNPRFRLSALQGRQLDLRPVAQPLIDAIIMAIEHHPRFSGHCITYAEIHIGSPVKCNLLGKEALTTDFLNGKKLNRTEVEVAEEHLAICKACKMRSNTYGFEAQWLPGSLEQLVGRQATALVHRFGGKSNILVS
jgi:hypothetical protein